MEKKTYQKPYIRLCEVESQVILAASGEEQGTRGSFNVPTTVIPGDDDDVWE